MGFEIYRSTLVKYREDDDIKDITIPNGITFI